MPVVTLRPNYDDTQDSAYPAGNKPTPAIPDDIPTYPTTFDYYIGPSGVNSNPGTIGSPWALTALQFKATTYVGKTVGILDGTYRSPITTANDEEWITIPATASGTTDVHTVIAAVNPRLAIITDNNGSGVYSTNPCFIFETGAAFLDIHGLKFSDCGAAPIRVSSSNVVISGCHFSDLDRAKSGLGNDNYGAIRGFGSRDTRVVNCKFEDIVYGWAVGPNFFTQRWIVEYCTAVDVEWGLGYLKRTAGDLTVRYCFYNQTGLGSTNYYGLFGYGGPLLGDDTTADGTPIWHAGTHSYHNNVCVGMGNVAGMSGEPGMNIVATEIYNNTFVMRDAVTGTMFTYDRGDQATSPTITNNQKLYNNIWTFRDSTLPGTTNRMVQWRSATVPLATVMNVMDYNGWHYFKMYNQASGLTYTDASGLTSVQALGYEAGSSITGEAGLSNKAGSSVGDFRVVSGDNLNGGRVGGVPAGAVCNRGAWDGVDRIYGTSSIGCNF